MKNINTNMDSISNNKWKTFSLNLPNIMVSRYSVKLASSIFYDKVLSDLDEKQYILVIFKIKTNFHLFRNMSTMQRINKFDYDFLLDSFCEYWNLKAGN